MLALSSLVEFHARRAPDRPAIAFGDETISYGALARRVAAVSGLLAAEGIGRGDVVAVVMKNSPAFVELALAAGRQGAVFLPVNYRLAADEAAYILADARTALLFVDEEFAGTLAALEGGVVPRVRVLGPEAQRDASTLWLRDDMPSPATVGPDDLMRLMYTSGTTSRPKGVLHHYGAFHWKHLAFVPTLDLSAATRLLIVGPLYHVGGLELPGLSVLALGGLVAIERDFSPEGVLTAIARHRLDGAWLAPTMTNAILACDRRGDFDTSSLRWVIGGGERTPESRIRSFAEAFPHARYVDAYGLTESNSGDTMMDAGFELAKIGSVGRPVPHVGVSIRNEAGHPLPPDVEGEICLTGPKITRGYWNDAEKTADCTIETPEGRWFRTGDVGRIDADGFLWLTDRKKDIIVTGGENVASSEVERVVYELPQVLEAAVIGLPDPRWGERPVAVVVLRAGASLDLDALARHCRRHLAGFKTPKELRIVDELPRNPSGKVLKRVLRDRMTAEGVR